MRFYVASGLPNVENAQKFIDAFETRGHECTYNWCVHGLVQHLGVMAMRRTASNEAQGVDRADFVVVLLPGGRGTHVELGMAINRGLRVYLVYVDEKLLGEDGHCTFYHHPKVKQVLWPMGFSLAQVATLTLWIEDDLLTRED